jgi:hypothetical protein
MLLGIYGGESFAGGTALKAGYREQGTGYRTAFGVAALRVREKMADLAPHRRASTGIQINTCYYSSVVAWPPSQRGGEVLCP